MEKFLNSQVIAWAAPITIALVQVVKKVGLNVRWIPIAALAVGVGVSYLFGGHILEGLVGGLSAIGLYETGKTTFG